MSPEEIEDIVIKSYRHLYGSQAVVSTSIGNWIDHFSKSLSIALFARSAPYSDPSNFTTTTTEFMPPDQQLWMDIAVAAARQDEFDLPEWPSEVANTTLDAFNKRFPATKP